MLSHRFKSWGVCLKISCVTGLFQKGLRSLSRLGVKPEQHQTYWLFVRFPSFYFSSLFCRFLFFLVDSYFLQIPILSCRFLFFLVDSYFFFQITILSCRFLFFPVDSYSFLQILILSCRLLFFLLDSYFLTQYPVCRYCISNMGSQLIEHGVHGRLAFPPS